MFLAIPFGVSALSRGITPPAGGTPLGLWLTWHLGLFLAATGPIVLASALIRGDAEPRRTGWWSWLGVAVAILAAVVGLYVWQPTAEWPSWFPLLWAPVLLVASLPLSTGQAVASFALAAGSLSSLLTWQAEQSGRMLQAQREVLRLGSEADPVARALLELFGNAVREAPPPVTATELYVLWRTSVLAEQGYPARLALWTQGIGWGADLALDSLEVGRPALDSMLSRLPRPDSVVTLPAPPGLHYMLTTPLKNGSLLVTVIGPQTQLITTSRLGRLLEPTVRRPPSYVLALSPPMAQSPPTAKLLWHREAWVLRAVRTLAVAGTTREVYVQTALRGPVPLLVRGAVLLLIDILVLAFVWLLSDYCGRHPIRLGPWRTAARSFRVRLAVTLALFFLVPTVGFSVWGIQRIALGTAGIADALISGTLRDALRSSGVLATRDSAYGAHELEALGQRMDADFGLYGGGRLTSTSARILQDLGVLGELMDPDAFRQLAFGGQLEVTRDGPLPTLAERVGYRLLLPGSPSHLGVLATPRRVGELSTDSQQDLAMALLLVLLLGLAAALLGAQSAARALSRPVADLRRAALALGEGKPAPPQERSPPSEFEPVFGAFNRMAADVRASREALEAARRRTETVLATVATGVIAVDPGGRVLLANRQAEQLLQAQLGEGVSLRDHLSADWASLVTQVEEALASHSSNDVPVEHTVGFRRVSAQHARLAGPLGGVVVALTDVTDMSRAERVLAWGEMARQVAHEIKNPLTPMRLGMQHLQRAWEDGRGDYDRILTETSERMLGEIDRLDRIARAFSRFAAPGDAQDPAGADRHRGGGSRGGATLRSLGCRSARRPGGTAGPHRAGAPGRAQGGAGQPAGECAQRRRYPGARGHRTGAHRGRGRRLGHRRRRPAACLRAALLHQHQRVGPWSLDREAAGGELGRCGGHQQRGRAGDDHHHSVRDRLIVAFGTAARPLWYGCRRGLVYRGGCSPASAPPLCSASTPTWSMSRSTSAVACPASTRSAFPRVRCVRARSGSPPRWPTLGIRCPSAASP